MHAKLKYANTCPTNLKPVCTVSDSVDGTGHAEGDLSVKILLITLAYFFLSCLRMRGRRSAAACSVAEELLD